MDPDLVKKKTSSGYLAITIYSSSIGYTICRENSARMEAAVNLVLKKEDLGIPGMPVPGKGRIIENIFYIFLGA